MKNCLVTKLNAIVDNDNLEKLGFIKMQVIKGSATSSDRQIFFQSMETPFTMEVSKGNLQAHYGTPLSNPYTESREIRTFYLPNEDCDIYFDKYKDFALEVNKTRLKANIADSYYSAINFIKGTGWYGKIIDANPANITIFYLDGNTDVVGELADFKDFVNLTTLRVHTNCGGGEPKVLGKLTALTDLVAKRMTGSVEDFVAAQRTNGRTTCDSISCPGLGINGTPYFNNVTFNGSLFTKTGTVILSWTDDTITLDGTTINS